MTKKISPDIGAFYQHYPRVAVVVTASAGGRDNAMTVAWHMPVSKDPPLICIGTSTGHFTYRLIKESGEFAVNLLPDTLAELVAAVGGSKGAECDKFESYNLKREKSVKTSAPVLQEAYATFECKLVDEKLYGDHSLLVGEVVAVHVEEDALMEDGTLNLGKIRPVLYMGGEQYLNIAGCKTRVLKRDVYAKELKS
jgi:flavin reductase (DIM6/NTAB) family NADH-FMN oxidoreductase RutF